MSESRLTDFLDYMRQAAAEACCFVEGMSKDDFLEDKRTQQAVIMSPRHHRRSRHQGHGRHPAFADAHKKIPWRSMRGMRKRIADGYFRHQPRCGVGHRANGTAGAPATIACGAT
jgi:uncharacterized protein with HEPN domain